MPPSLAELNIHSQRDADELERELGIRFDDFTPEDADTWTRQNAYLNQYSENRLVTIAADAADVAVRTVRQWQFEDVLGFNRRLGIAVLYYTDMLESMLLKRVQEPGSPPSLLTMLLRAQMPEKYGSVRRSGPPRDNNDDSHHGDHDHDPQLPPIPQPDHDLLQGIFQDLQNLKQFAGLPEPDFTPPQPDPTPNPSAPSAPPAVNPSPQNLAPNTQNPSSPSPSAPSVPSAVNPSPQNPTPSTQNPPLPRSQRRQLQRKQRKLQKTNRTRAPT